MVEDIANYLRDPSERNYIMFLMGIYTGLRISDILQRRISDVKDKENIVLREQKAQKRREIGVNPLLKKELTLLSICCRP